VELFLKNSNLCDHNSPTSQTDGWTDGRTDRQTTCDRNTALCTKVHRAVKTRLFVKNSFTRLSISISTLGSVALYATGSCASDQQSTNDRKVAGSRPTKVVCITVLTGNRMGMKLLPAVAGRHSFFRAVGSWSLDCQR